MDIKAKTLSTHVPRTSNPGTVHLSAGGVARNIAHNLARLGQQVSLLSVVGNDANAEMLLEVTKAAGVNVQLIIRVNDATGTYLAALDVNGELITAVNDMRLLTPAMIDDNREAIAAASMVVADCNLDLDCLLKINTQCLVIEPVSVPKSKRLLEILQHRPIYLATPNLDQIEALTGTRNPQLAAKSLHKLGLQNLVIHAGERGSYVSDGSTMVHVPSQAKTIVDVTGAGDAATAGLVHGLMQKLSLEKSATIGQEMAARVIASTLSTLD